MNAQRSGIVTSLAIHACFLFLFLILPVEKSNPYAHTFYISFAEQESSPSLDHREIKQVIRPRVEEERIVSKPEIAAIEQPRDEFIADEKPVTGAAQKTENVNPAKTEVASLGKAESRSFVETVFGHMGAPTFIRREMPVYPRLARRLGKEGKVILKLFIDKDGILQNIEVMESSEFGFTEAAIAAVKRSSFSPAHLNGKKISSKAILPVRFHLE